MNTVYHTYKICECEIAICYDTLNLVEVSDAYNSMDVFGAYNPMAVSDAYNSWFDLRGAPMVDFGDAIVP